MKDVLLMVLNLYRLLPAWLLVLSSKDKDLILDEMEHWKECLRRNQDGFHLVAGLVLKNKEYRNLLCFRIRGGGVFVMLLLEVYSHQWNPCLSPQMT